MAEKKVSILLSGGVDNRSLEELVAPIAMQGQAPLLRASKNTRLGVTPGGVVRSPEFVSALALTASTRVCGAVSAGAGKRTLLMCMPEQGIPQRVVADAGRTSIGASAILTDGGGAYPAGSGRQQSALPAQVVDSVSIPGPANTQYATNYNSVSGCLFTAWLYVRPETGAQTYYVVVSAETLGGVRLAQPRTVQLGSAAPATFLRWVGVTTHGAVGDRVWYVNPAGAICFRTLAVANNAITVGAESVVYTPGSATTGIDVCNVNASFAALVCSDAVAANGRVMMIDIVTAGTYASDVIVNALLGGGHCAVTSATLSAGVRIGAVFSAVTGSTAKGKVYDTVMAAVSATPTLGCTGKVSIAFGRQSSADGLALFAEDAATSPALVQVRASVYTVSSGALAGAMNWYGVALAGHAATWSCTASQMFPVVPLVPQYGTTLTAPGEANFVDDPSIELVWLSSPAVGGVAWAPFARLGVVRGTTAPAEVAYTAQFASKGLITVSDDMHCAYRLQDSYDSSQLRTGRRSVVRVATSNRLNSTHDRDGVGLLAGALPLQWDGRNVAELGAPIHVPHLAATLVPGAGPQILPAGAHSYMAVAKWRDAAGLLHRSRPTAVQTVTPNGTTEGVSLAVTTQDFLMQQAFDAAWLYDITYEVYATTANGKTFHVVDVGGSKYGGKQSAEAVTSSAQIYSGGAANEEIVPQPPPPAWDIWVIGSRCWIVDAEVRSRVVHSKLRVAGVGFEFSPALEILLPSGAGKVMAVREWQGMPIIITERAVYQVSGEGPSNTLNGGGAFSTPVKVSDLGCSNTASVVVCPGGILWQFADRFVMLGASGVSYVSTFACSHDVSAAFTLTKYGEVLFFSATTTEVRVYHYEKGTWTTWDAGTLGATVQVAQLMPFDPDTALVYSESTGVLRRVEANSLSAGNMSWETDWMLLGGDFQDHVDLSWVIFNGKLTTNHDVKIDVLVDYEAAVQAANSRTYTAATLATLAVNGKYSIRQEVSQANCRAVKIVVTETLQDAVNRQGLSPRSLTVVYKLLGPIFEDAFKQGSTQ